MDFKQSIAGCVEEALNRAFGQAPLTGEEIAQALEVPRIPGLGDYAFPCFKLAKGLRKAPPLIAQQLKAAMDSPFLSRVEAVKGYLNFYIDRGAVRPGGGGDGPGARRCLRGGSEGAGKTVCIDYSSINIAKRFHIGHLSTTMIGHALSQLYRFRGYRVVSINHLGTGAPSSAR